MHFPDAQFVEDVVTKLAPILFNEYRGGSGDFAYLGGDQGRAKMESALAQPRQTFYGEFLYPTIADKAAALLWSITKNHPFVDGNKRAALTTVNLFLLMNGHVLLSTQNDALTICLRIAGGEEPIQQDEVSEWINSRIVSDLDEDAIERVTQFVGSIESSDFGSARALLAFHQTVSSLTEMARKG